MNNDEEWITVSQLKSELRRDHVVDDEINRCRELNLQGERCYDAGDFGQAEEYFTRAFDALYAIDDNAVSYVESRNAKCIAQARAELGIAQCQARAIPEYTWCCESGDLDEKSDGAARRAWAGLLEFLDGSLECCEGYEGDESDELLEVKALAMLWRARSLDGVFEYDCVSGLGGGEEDYLGCDENVRRPDFEYAELVGFLRSLVENNSDRFEPLLLEAMTDLAKWQSFNCDITNNVALYGASEFDPDDCARRRQESLDLMEEVLRRRQRLAAKSSKE